MGVQTEAPPSARERRSSPQVNVAFIKLQRSNILGKVICVRVGKVIFDLIFCQSANFFNDCCCVSKQFKFHLFLFPRKLGFNFPRWRIAFCGEKWGLLLLLLSKQSGVFCFAKLKIIQQNPEFKSCRNLNASSEIMFDDAREREKSKILCVNVTEVASRNKESK